MQFRVSKRASTNLYCEACPPDTRIFGPFIGTTAPIYVIDLSKHIFSRLRLCHRNPCVGAPSRGRRGGVTYGFYWNGGQGGNLTLRQSIVLTMISAFRAESYPQFARLNGWLLPNVHGHPSIDLQSQSLTVIPDLSVVCLSPNATRQHSFSLNPG